MSNIKMYNVDSSNIEAVGYDEQNQIVHVRFLSQTTYIYKNVPLAEFDGLLNAPSVGKYLAKNYKNNYPYEQID